MTKVTAVAPANIAFIKYWGKKDKKLRLPLNSSLSMNLSALSSTTTVEFSPQYKKDQIIIDKKSIKVQVKRVVKHLDRIRKMAGISLYARVESRNNFPKSTGLSSSASGFAALTVAAAKAAGLSFSKKQLTILSRLASGSSCRSIPDGFVEWQAGKSHQSSFAFSVYQPNFWHIYDIVLVFSRKEKEISSTLGQQVVFSSPFLEKRLSSVGNRMIKIKKALKNKNFSLFGSLIEEDALEMSAVMLTSKPSLIYWSEQTLSFIKLTKKWRKRGLKVYFTFNTGQNLHLFCQKRYLKELMALLKRTKGIRKIYKNKPAKGVRLITNHLF